LEGVAVTGFKDFTDGPPLTASDINEYLMQGVLVFADATARDTALSGFLREGRYCYLKDSNATWLYNGTDWVSAGNSPATYSGTTGSPTITTVSGKTCVKFTGTGTITIATAGLVRVRSAGGGGAGGGVLDGVAGGGGAGGVDEYTYLFLAAGGYTITVVAGGAGSSGLTTGGDGTGSKIASASAPVDVYVVPGGKGGTGATSGGYGVGGNAGGYPDQGYAGSAGAGPSGGGAGGAGGSNVGGIGLASDITGSSVTLCVGGLPAQGSGAGAAGTANTGMGGNGAGGGSPAAGGNGGSGVVILLFG